MIGRARVPVSLLLNLLLAGCAGNTGITIGPLSEASPAKVQAEFSPGLRVFRDGSPYMDLWFRADLPTVEAKSPVERVLYNWLKPGGLIGVVRIHQVAVDFRAQKVQPGLYTLRYGVQPDDGDHEDKTELRNFLLLCPAAEDVSSALLDHKALTRLSATLNGKKHPAVLYLDWPSCGPLPGVVQRVDPGRTIVEVAAGKGLRLSIVIVGQYMD